MTTLILTVAGADRPGLVAAVADVVAAHDGNWENSRLAELAGLFAGVVQISLPATRVDAVTAAVQAIDGLTVMVHTAADAEDQPSRTVELQILGNDRPGIVREISAVLSAHGVSIDTIEAATRDAAMAGGRLFEASVAAEIAASEDLDALRADLERLTSELQVDITLDQAGSTRTAAPPSPNGR